MIAGGPILVVAAHPDDEALGCGGTMARHAAAGDAVHVIFLTDGVSARSDDTASLAGRAERKNAARQAAKLLGASEPIFFDFPDNQLDTVPLLHLAQSIESVAEGIKPRFVYTHHVDDLNIDHGLCHRAVLTAFRPAPGQSVRAIYAFEVASSTEWRFGEAGTAFTPQRFVDIADHLETKRAALAAYATEMREWPHSRSDRALRALAEWRGASAGLEAAEAFMVIREIT